MPLRPLLLTLLCLGLLLPPTARGQEASFGPLTHEDGSPLHRVSYTPSMEGADPVPPGTLQADLWLGYANIFEQDSAATHELFLDLERLITATTLRWGVVEDLEVGGRLTFETTGGGILDPVISGFHNRLGLGNANRERYPKDQHAQLLRDGEGRIRLYVPQGTFVLEDVRLFGKWRMWREADGGSSVSLRATARIPTRRNLVGEERSDLALAVLGRTRWGRVFLHGMAGGSTVRASPELDPVLRDAAWFLTLAAEYPLLPWASAVAQFTAASPRLKGFDDVELDGLSGSLVLGFSGTAGSGWRWDAGFQEDVPLDRPSVDFTLGLRVGRAF